MSSQYFFEGKMLDHYFKLVAESLQDTVAKTIMTELVNQVKSSVQVRLCMSLCKDELMEKLFYENQDVISTRQENEGKLKVPYHHLVLYCATLLRHDETVYLQQPIPKAAKFSPWY